MGLLSIKRTRAGARAVPGIREVTGPAATWLGAGTTPVFPSDRWTWAHPPLWKYRAATADGEDRVATAERGARAAGAPVVMAAQAGPAGPVVRAATAVTGSGGTAGMTVTGAFTASSGDLVQVLGGSGGLGGGGG